MFSPSDTDPPAAPSATDDLVEVGVYDSAISGSEHGLVVLALGHAYWLMPAEGRYRLLVERDVAGVVRRHLASFDRESIGWPPQPPHDEASGRQIDLATPLLWALIVLAAFWAEAAHPGLIDAGALDATAVFRDHEAWRTITALFLHRDAAHVVSNGFSGIFVFAAVTSTFGRLRGWSSILVAGVLGNAAAVALHFGGEYRSVGASTAVFGAVGLLTGRAIRRMVDLPRPHRARAMFVPLASGMTVLALYGAGGVHVDVLAHLTGFVAGAIIGVVGAMAGKPPTLRSRITPEKKSTA